MYGNTYWKYVTDIWGKQKSIKLKTMQRMSKEINVIKICMKVGFKSISLRNRMAIDMAFPEIWMISGYWFLKHHLAGQNSCISVNVNRVTRQRTGWRDYLMKRSTPGSHQKKFDLDNRSTLHLSLKKRKFQFIAKW